jgi:endonuclease G
MKLQLHITLLFMVMVVLGYGQATEQTLYPRSTYPVISKQHYALGYSEAHEQAAWVFYELTRQEALGGYERTNNFKADPEVVTGSASLADYKGSGYDRGHLAPAGDMAFSPIAMQESFYMSNMSPQDPSFNRGIWKQCEALVRAWAQEDGEVYVVTGPVLTSGLPSIGVNKVSVPEYYYKVVLDWDSNEVRAIGFLLPNAKGSQALNAYAVSIDEVERVTGLDFFPGLPDKVENLVEARITGAWDFSASPTSITRPSGTASPAPQCKGITQAGDRCKRKTRSESGYCHQHEGQIGTPAQSTSTRCTGSTQSGNRCKRMTKNASGRCWQHE